jgi:hypothetical protein
MAAYTSTQSGNFSSTATWGGNGYPSANADTFTVVAGHTVTYDLATPLNEGLGTSVIAAGGTWRFNANTAIRFNGSFQVNGNFFMNTGVKVLLKGTTSVDNVFDIRNYTQLTTTAVSGTAGQFTIVVASSANMIVGNKLGGTGIGSNATITQINGTTVTLSVANSGTVSGTITIGSTVEMIGSEGMASTVITAAVGADQYQQGFITVSDPSIFAVNDWVAFYERNMSDSIADREDEGFIIHDISGNNLYLREFVGPTATITAVDRNFITVSNAKVFRTWQALIFGTGANRNTSKIAGINYGTNTIQLVNTPTGSFVGQTVYTTGPLKPKLINVARARKAATTVATQAAANATQIVLSSVAGFSVGDEILIDARWPGDSSYTDERPEKRNITAIAGNTITINAALGYIAYVEAFVVRLTRDIEITGDYEITLTLNAAQSFAINDVITQAYSGARGVVKTATTNSTTVVIQDIFGAFATGTTNSPWLSKNGTPIAGNAYVSSQVISTAQGHAGFALNRGSAFTTNNLPCLQMRDIEFTTFSNTNSTTSRIWLRGQWSSPTQANGGVEFEGLTWATPSQTDNFNYQVRGIYIQRYLNDATFRLGVSYNTTHGIWADEGYNLQNLGVFNNYSARSETYCYGTQHLVGGAWEFAYNYAHRADDIGFIHNAARWCGRGIHHNWANVAQGRTVQIDTGYGSAYYLFQNRYQRGVTPINTNAGRSMQFLYNEFIDTATQAFTSDSGYHAHNTSVAADFANYSLEHNYVIDSVMIYFPNGQRLWDPTQQAWRVITDDNNGNSEYGMDEVIFIPAGTTVSVQGTLRFDPAFNGTSPKLEILDSCDRFYYGTQNEYATTNYPLIGARTNATFNVSNRTTYQSVTITHPPKNYSRFATVGIINVNQNASEGWWEKPLQIRYDTLPAGPFVPTGIGVRTITGQVSAGRRPIGTPITRIGGRVL